MEGIAQQRLACRSCGQALDSTGVCPVCARAQIRTRNAVAVTGLITVVLLALLVLLLAVDVYSR